MGSYLVIEIYAAPADVKLYLFNEFLDVYCQFKLGEYANELSSFDLPSFVRASSQSNKCIQQITVISRFDSLLFLIFNNS